MEAGRRLFETETSDFHCIWQGFIVSSPWQARGDLLLKGRDFSDKGDLLTRRCTFYNFLKWKMPFWCNQLIFLVKTCIDVVSTGIHDRHYQTF